MNRANILQLRYPGLDRHLKKVSLTTLPTPVRGCALNLGAGNNRVWIKQDNLSGGVYGGNKVRKLEYLFGRLQQRGCRRVATFGAVGSNHALATALYARKIDLQPVCFLSHQTRTALAARTLNMHLETGSKIVLFGGTYPERLQTLRNHLRNRCTGVIPMGGSSWLGSVGLVNAGLEIAEQVSTGELPQPDRIYLAAGTMGTAAGLALGLALAGLGTQVHAVRVSHSSIANHQILNRLTNKTAAMLHRLEPDFPADLGRRTNVVLRNEFFAPGYAHSNAETERAIDIAMDQLGVTLEATYTGKALAALINDFRGRRASGRNVLFWNTYHSAPLPAGTARPADTAGLPEQFLSYFH